MQLYPKQRLTNKVGGKRAALNCVWYQMQLYLGGFRRYLNVDLGQVQRLVYVCHGNICRSPYAYRLTQVHDFPTLSFGLGADPDNTAYPMAQEIAAERGVSIAAHRASHIRDYSPTIGDLLLGFEPVHSRALERILGHHEGIAISLLGLWRNPSLAYIHDPYGLSADYFRVCFQQIEEAVFNLLRLLPKPDLEKAL